MAQGRMVWGSPCTHMFIATVHYLVLWVDFGPEGIRQHSFKYDSNTISDWILSDLGKERVEKEKTEIEFCLVVSFHWDG